MILSPKYSGVVQKYWLWFLTFYLIWLFYRQAIWHDFMGKAKFFWGFIHQGCAKVFLKGAGELGQSQVIKLELCLQYIIDAAVIFPTVFPLPEQISSSKARNSVYVHTYKYTRPNGLIHCTITFSAWSQFWYWTVGGYFWST